MNHVELNTTALNKELIFFIKENIEELERELSTLE